MKISTYSAPPAPTHRLYEVSYTAPAPSFSPPCPLIQLPPPLIHPLCPPPHLPPLTCPPLPPQTTRSCPVPRTCTPPTCPAAAAAGAHRVRAFPWRHATLCRAPRLCSRPPHHAYTWGSCRYSAAAHQCYGPFPSFTDAYLLQPAPSPPASAFTIPTCYSLHHPSLPLPLAYLLHTCLPRPYLR